MRLYLSSFDVGDEPAEFVKLAPRGRVGIIMNALDNRPLARPAWQAAQTKKLERLGFTVEPLDLRDFFGRAGDLAAHMEALDAVWVNGGNAFLLRRAMRLSGFDHALTGALAADDIAYGGFSAAAVVLAASLRGLELVDDPHDVPEGYPEDVPWDGLGVLAFSIVVHFDSDHPETEGSRKEAAFYEACGIPYRTLRDGQALVICNGSEFVVPARSGAGEASARSKLPED
jgi:dipeptidase E